MKVSFAIVTLTLTIGCVAKYVPYDPDAFFNWRGGYSEHKLASDIYEVRYAWGGRPPRRLGNGHLPQIPRKRRTPTCAGGKL